MTHLLTHLLLFPSASLPMTHTLFPFLLLEISCLDFFSHAFFFSQERDLPTDHLYKEFCKRRFGSMDQDAKPGRWRKHFLVLHFSCACFLPARLLACPWRSTLAALVAAGAEEEGKDGAHAGARQKAGKAGACGPGDRGGKTAVEGKEKWFPRRRLARAPLAHSAVFLFCCFSQHDHL